MRQIILLVGLCASLAIGGCGTDPIEPSDDPLWFSAVVADLLKDPAAPGTVGRLLVLHPGQAELADRSLVRISGSTEIVKRTSSGSLVPASPADIRIGRTARFRIEDVELRSYPRQVFAIRIEL